LTALLAALALGVAMIVATIGTFKHDVVFAAPLLLQFWLLASPIMYPLGNVPERWKGAYSFNPMVGIVEGFRAALLRGSAPDWELIAPAVLVTLLTLALAWPAFRYCSQYFADAL
jgi:lipopolysaccharide transport system permease protein